MSIPALNAPHGPTLRSKTSVSRMKVGSRCEHSCPPCTPRALRAPDAAAPRATPRSAPARDVQGRGVPPLPPRDARLQNAPLTSVQISQPGKLGGDECIKTNSTICNFVCKSCPVHTLGVPRLHCATQRSRNAICIKNRTLKVSYYSQY